MSKYNKIFLALIFYMISIFIYNYSYFINYKQKEIATVDDKLRIGAYAVYNVLGVDFFKTAINKDSISIQEDWENIKKLSFYNDHANLAFIYSSIKKENKIYLTSSSASKEEVKEKNELHYFHYYDDAGDGLVKAFETKKTVYENYTDKWGSFRAVHIPILLENGQLIVVSSEISMEHYNQILSDIKYKYFWETLLYIFLTIPIILTVYFANKASNLQTLKMEQDLMKSEKMASLGEMITNISHQWRQPLSIISTAASGVKIKKQYDNLEENDLDETLDIIILNTKYLSNTIENFRSYIDNTDEVSICCIDDTITKTLDILKGSLAESNIEVILDLNANVKIESHPNELIQALINVISNSKDAYELNNIKKRYLFITTNKMNDKIQIRIKDNGKGISESIIQNIFDPYFTTKFNANGTGLGLYISYKIVTERLKGSINASNSTFKYQNEAYTGAEFIFEIPIKLRSHKI